MMQEIVDGGRPLQPTPMIGIVPGVVLGWAKDSEKYVLLMEKVNGEIHLEDQQYTN